MSVSNKKCMYVIQTCVPVLMPSGTHANNTHKPVCKFMCKCTYVSNAHVVLFSLATLWTVSALAQCGIECDLFSMYFFLLDFMEFEGILCFDYSALESENNSVTSDTFRHQGL